MPPAHKTAHMSQSYLDVVRRHLFHRTFANASYGNNNLSLVPLLHILYISHRLIFPFHLLSHVLETVSSLAPPLLFLFTYLPLRSTITAIKIVAMSLF